MICFEGDIRFDLPLTQLAYLITDLAEICGISDQTATESGEIIRVIRLAVDGWLVWSKGSQIF